MLGGLMLLLWILFQAHIYGAMWGFWGFIGSFIFFIPLTLYTFFLFLIAGQYMDLLASVSWVVVSLAFWLYVDM